MITWHTGSFDRVHVRCEPAGIISPSSTTRAVPPLAALGTLNFPKCVYPRPIVASCPSWFNEWESACALESACACGGGGTSCPKHAFSSMLFRTLWYGSDNYIVLAGAVLSRSFCFGSLLFALATLTRVAIANSGYERGFQRVEIECLYNVIGKVNF